GSEALPETTGGPAVSAFKEAKATTALAVHLEKLADADDAARPDRARLFRGLAKRLRRCSVGRMADGYRCGLGICPRCAVKKAKRYRKRLEKRFRTNPGMRLWHVTATVACDDPMKGYFVLTKCLRHLRRRKKWRAAVLGGEQNVQPEPSTVGQV